MGKHKIKKPAIFLDRDGTLIRQANDIVKISGMKPIRGVVDALAIFRRLGFLLIVITNQPVVSKGLIDLAGIDRLHKALSSHLKKGDIAIDEFYVCPHNKWDNCTCRKPNIGSLKKAQKKYNIDFKRSYFIGDSMRDVATGKKAKLKTILLKTGKAGSDKDQFDVKPDFVVRDLLAAAKLIQLKQRTA